MNALDIIGNTENCMQTNTLGKQLKKLYFCYQANHAQVKSVDKNFGVFTARELIFLKGCYQVANKATIFMFGIKNMDEYYKNLLKLFRKFFYSVR